MNSHFNDILNDVSEILVAPLPPSSPSRPTVDSATSTSFANTWHNITSMSGSVGVNDSTVILLASTISSIKTRNQRFFTIQLHFAVFRNPPASPLIVGNFVIISSPLSTTTVTFVVQKMKRKMIPPMQDERIKQMKWRKNVFFEVPVDKMEVKGNYDLPSDVKELSTPIQFFKYFFYTRSCSISCSETNQYSTSLNVNQPVNVTVAEMWKYLGICFMSTVMQFKNVRLYWAS